MKYKIWNTNNIDGSTSTAILGISDNGDILGIPNDPLNVDYLGYVAWLFEGNTPEEWNPETEPASEPVIEETPADSTEEPVTEDAN
jgi:hypothetical protein